MMKLSFCSIAYRSQRISLNDIIPKVAGYGYNAIAIWGQHLRKVSSLWDLKQTLALNGLEVSIISPYFNFTGTSTEWKKSIERAEYFIDCAYQLNALGIRCFTGRVGSRVSTPEQWQNCITGIRTIADMAGRRGIKIFVETHPDTLADTTISTLRLMKGINRENVGIIFDTYNMWEAEADSLFDSFVTLFPYIKHMHLKNANARKKENSPFSLVHVKGADLSTISYIDNGDVIYENHLNFLNEKKFDGYLSVEWFGNDVETAALKEINYLKSYFAKLRSLSQQMIGIQNKNQKNPPNQYFLE